jgi:ADP-ribose pyrophosphatase YjhB (NUDIX family)
MSKDYNKVRRRFSQFIRRFPIVIRIPYYLFRFIQTRYTIGVVGVIIDETDNILLVEHVFHPYHPWGLPGGWIGYNEDPAVAVTRELAEELNLQAEVQDILLVERGFRNHIDIAFRCIVHNKVGQLSKELLDYQWVNMDQLPKLNDFHTKAINLAIKQSNES